MAVKRGFNPIAAQIGVSALLMVLAIKQVSAEVQVPNEFSSGTPAKASEVNENFAALVEDIQGFTEPEKNYSIISSEILDSGLIRTQLYAYELSDYSMTARLDEADDDVYIADGVEYVVSALGTFRGQYSYLGDYGQPNPLTISHSPPGVSCPAGGTLQRQPNDIVYNVSIRNEKGGFVFSSRGTDDAGIYVGCDAVTLEDGSTYELSEYYFLEGSGSGIYSCVSKVAWHGAFGGGDGKGWSKAYAPARTIYPNIVAGIFDRATNSKWGTYYLVIDAPADCLNI